VGAGTDRGTPAENGVFKGIGEVYGPEKIVSMVSFRNKTGWRDAGRLSVLQGRTESKSHIV